VTVNKGSKADSRYVMYCARPGFRARRFVPLGLRREESIKVEINLNENASLYPLVSVELDTLDDDGETVCVTARSYDINEMLGTKMRALMQREQGRDLFDLVHAWHLSEAGSTPYPVDGAKAMDAFAWYLEKEGMILAAMKPMRYSTSDCASRPFVGTWTRCCARDYPKFDVDEVRRSYGRLISST
jgi:hypothetical protein